METIIIRTAIKSNDLEQLKQLFKTAFHPEKVDEFAEVLYQHLPNLKKEYWLVAEDTSKEQIVAALALIPWEWKMENTIFKVAEMGIVATLPEYRGKGLMHKLNKAFENVMQEEGFFLSSIQGIPGFYHKLGYEYAVELENHIYTPLDLLNNLLKESEFSFRMAEKSDIPFLMDEEQKFQQKFELSVNKSAELWNYQLRESLKTECASEIWMIETNNQQYYFKILLHGFGAGLILSEMSEGISFDAMQASFSFIKSLAIKKQKPYVRLNMHRESTAAKHVLALGANGGKSYALQVKITEPIKLLRQLVPVLEKRIRQSEFNDFTGIFRLNLYQFSIDLNWNRGMLISIEKGNDQEQMLTFNVNPRWFPMLCLGHRNWEEIQWMHPDVKPEFLVLNPIDNGNNAKIGKLMQVLFPKVKGWINLQY